jgi:hypothetical protein
MERFRAAEKKEGVKCYITRVVFYGDLDNANFVYWGR